MSGQQVGYLRVSTVIQNTARQLEGVALDKVFEDRASGKNTDRPQLAACLSHLREGDTLHVHSMDRLCRNLDDLRRIVKDLTGRGVVVRFHKEGLTFTGEDSPCPCLGPLLSLNGQSFLNVNARASLLLRVKANTRVVNLHSLPWASVNFAAVQRLVKRRQFWHGSTVSVVKPYMPIWLVQTQFKNDANELHSH